MENRRACDRFRYPAGERPTIRLEFTSRPLELTGVLLDLGVEGLRVRLAGSAPALALDDTFTAHLDLPRLGAPLAVPCAVVYLERAGATQECGAHFLPRPGPPAGRRRAQVLEQYLQREQRRHRPVRRRADVFPRLFTGR